MMVRQQRRQVSCVCTADAGSVREAGGAVFLSSECCY